MTLKKKKSSSYRSKIKFLKFFGLLVFGLVNLCVDWFFYTRIELIEPGLIYGPPDQNLKLIIFIFCVISSVGFVIEIIHNIDDLAPKRKLIFLSQSLTNFIVIVFTDLPLIVLNLIITACHDGQPTFISLVKSSVCIGMFVVRFILMIAYRCCARKKIKSQFKFVIDLLSTIGLIAVVLISIKIQLLRIFPTRASGGFFRISDPAKFKTMDFVKFKYLNDVGIFVKWPLSEQDNRSQNSSYLWLADINDVIDETFLKVTIKTDYAITQDELYHMCFVKMKKTECFRLDKNTYYFDKVSNSLNMEHFNTYDLMITKEPAQAYRYLLGYIDYNMNKVTTHKQNTSCLNNQRVDSMLYAKFLPFWQSEKKSFLRQMGNRFTFYNNNIDLQTVDNFWRTGIFGCHMTGDLGPKFNQRILIDC